MSFHVFFDFSTGLKAMLLVPKGTVKSIMDHVKHIETVFGLRTTKYKDNPPHWESKKPTTDISDKQYCTEAEEHNKWVQWLYHRFCEWSKNPVANGEPLTPKKAQRFFHALTMLHVPPERWTPDYYRARMESLYEVMRGRENEGITFDEKPLSEKQAANVIRLFEQYLDPGDLRLDVPLGEDYLASSSDGGYVYCDKCGPVTNEHLDNCRKRGCPARKDYR